MKTRNIILGGIFAVMLALAFAACDENLDQGGIITYTAVQTGGANGTADSTGIVFTFSAPVDGLTADMIAVSGAASKGAGALTGSGTSWTLPIAVSSAGQATVSISKEGVETASKSVTVHKDGQATPDVQKPELEPVIGSGTFGDFEYEYGAATVTITGYNGSGGAVSIPSTIDGKPVVAIKDGTSYTKGVFLGKGLTGVTIPDSVVYIGDYAFRGNNLTSVTIPDSVTFIGEQAFFSNKLTSVTIPDNVITIGDAAFRLNELNSVAIGNSVTTIEAWAFSANELTGVIIPDSVTYIGDNAFCTNKLTSVTIGNSVTYIGEQAFIDWNDRYNGTIPNITVNSSNTAYTTKNFFLMSKDEKILVVHYGSEKNVAIPDNVITIRGSAFYNNQLTGVTIPNSVTYIGRRAFSDNQLTGVTIPNSVTTIGRYAFSDNQLTSVTIPNSVTTMESNAFADNELTSITIGENVTLSDDSFSGSSPGDSGRLFVSFYTSNGKKAGTYNYSNGNWSKVN